MVGGSERVRMLGEGLGSLSCRGLSRAGEEVHRSAQI